MNFRISNLSQKIKIFEKLGIDNSSDFYSKKSQKNIFTLLETGRISENELIKEIHSTLIS